MSTMKLMSNSAVLPSPSATLTNVHAFRDGPKSSTHFSSSRPRSPLLTTTLVSSSFSSFLSSHSLKQPSFPVFSWVTSRTPPAVRSSLGGENASLVHVLREGAQRVSSLASGAGVSELAGKITQAVDSTLDAIPKSSSFGTLQSFTFPPLTSLSQNDMSTSISAMKEGTFSAISAVTNGAMNVSSNFERISLETGAANGAEVVGTGITEQVLPQFPQDAGKIGNVLGGIWKEAEGLVAFQDSAPSSGLSQALSSAFVSSPSISRLFHAVADLLQSTEKVSSSASSSFQDAVNRLVEDPSLLISAARDLAKLSAESLAAAADSASLAVTNQPGALPILATIAGTGLGVIAGNEIVRTFDIMEKGSELPSRYDPARIAAYFQLRPLDVLLRSARIFAECSQFVASIYLDRARGLEKENERKRAQQLVDLITRLGPTAIKVGQALSIRPDLLSLVYLEELQTLQDRVPSFSNEDAQQIIRQGLGRDASEIFSNMSPEPVAAASLGQVYKAKLRATGDVVAVKVQRPGVREGICCDLFVLRILARAAMSLPNVHSDLVDVLDMWARRFFDELDYVQEGRNAIRFDNDMKELRNVRVPGVFMEYTSRKVLTTEWVEGEKLSESRAPDLGSLVTTALNCYLIQLLETGFLHADPHPGNLLRTPDGKLCVLDYGLMTEVSQDQQYALIEYISHLVNSDFERVAEDLVVLGFVPPELVDPAKTAAVVPQLSRVLGQLTQGGGARKVNIAQVTDDLSRMAEEYVFVIPPYFALILRAFGVLEGIGLDNDPDYTIVDECYPYISKRLLTDDSPRTRQALRYFLYGKEDRLDVDRVEELANGFQTFRSLMAPSSSSSLTVSPSSDTQLVSASTGGGRREKGGVDPTARQIILTALAPEGSYLQELLLTELVRTVDALSRETLAEVWSLLVARTPLPVPTSLAAPGTFPLPVGLPGVMLGLTKGEWRAARVSEEDERALGTVRRLWAFLEPQFQPSATNPIPSSPSDILQVIRDAVPFVREVFPGATTTASRFLVMLVQRQALRLADDLDGRDSVLDWEKDPFAYARNIPPLFSLTTEREWTTRDVYETRRQKL